MPIGGPARGGTPSSRIAQIARWLLVERLEVEGQKPGEKPPWPYVPDTMDFAAAIHLQVEYELVQARIAERKIEDDGGRLKALENEERLILARMRMP